MNDKKAGKADEELLFILDIFMPSIVQECAVTNSDPREVMRFLLGPTDLSDQEKFRIDALSEAHMARWQP